MFLFVNSLFRMLQCSNPDRNFCGSLLWKVFYGNFTKKRKSDSLDIMTCDNWVFKMGKKTNIQPYILVMSHMHFRVNPHSIVV